MQLRWYAIEFFFSTTTRKAIEKKKIGEILINVSKERWRRATIR
jgi:hypothetical protein